jgi:drug/metabolite transporter (DMT)-like permease
MRSERELTQRTAYALLMLVTVIWGSTFFITRQALQLTHPFMFLSLRFTFATLLLSALFHARLRRLTRYELLHGGFIGLFLFTTLALQTLGLQTTSASKAAFLVTLYVPAVPLFALPLLRQRPSRRVAVGILLSFGGLLLLSVNNRLALQLGRGEWLLLGGALTTALHIVAISKYAPGADAINLTVVQVAVTALLSGLSLLLTREPHALPPPSVWLAAILMGLFATAFAFVVMNRVQQSVSSTRATLIYALEPVWAAGFGLLAGETLSATAWAGCGLVFVGMIAGSVRFRPRRLRPAV